MRIPEGRENGNPGTGGGAGGARASFYLNTHFLIFWKMQPSHYRRIHCPTLKTSFFKERRNQKEPLGPKCTRNSLYSLAAASGRAVAAHYYTNRYPAGRAGASPRAPAAPGRRSLAPLATGTVQTITISRHFAAEQEGEKAQNRPRDKQKYNQLTTSLQTGKGDCATTTTCSGLALSRCLSLIFSFF